MSCLVIAFSICLFAGDVTKNPKLKVKERSMPRVAKTVPTKLAPFMTTHNLSVGADPEMFVFAGEKLLPAFAFLPKKGGNTTVYWDGFQAEWKYSGGIWCLDAFCYE